MTTRSETLRVSRSRSYAKRLASKGMRTIAAIVFTVALFMLAMGLGIGLASALAHVDPFDPRTDCTGTPDSAV